MVVQCQHHKHLAYEYAKKGARLVLAARRRQSLEQVADMANWLGAPDVIPVHADVSKVEDCQRLIEEVINNFGRLDHLVINAAVTPLYMFEDLIEVTNAAPAMDINFWGAVYTTHFAIPHLKETKGKIIAITSSAGYLNAARISLYCASKAAMISFFETLRVELGTQIGITIVTPGLVESELTKGKFLTTEGKLEVNQVMRDVEMSVTPILPVEKCARSIVKSACRGDNYLTEPAWFKTLFYYRIFFPELVEWFQRWFLIPGQGRPPTEAPSKHLAYEYAKKGARLVLAARRRKSLEQVADMANSLGSPHVIPVPADVSKVKDCQRLIEEATSNFGRCKKSCND
ncbi:hypothetical protein K7X08_028058 [Anisodus acutangulus]|uniref:Uncharacterized protein n=1 Tax=Anisodus acutangulus TaxID=402998 RepID=A0A9Q1MU02_9SOLA|nr:hypothetical protein K7X08_028058 [Anisodus acutangulus]